MLHADVDGTDYADVLHGGIDADTGYDIGGLRTQLAGEVTITSRSRGTLADGALTGAVG